MTGTSTTPALKVGLASPEATGALGGALASLLQAGDVVVLSGALGAGKTTLVKGMVAALCSGLVATSPTFALCHLYETVPVIAHVDCWRLAHESELEDLALAELLEEGAVAVIEWGELAEARFGDDALVVALSLDEAGAEPGRRALLQARGSFASRLVALERACTDAGLCPHRLEQGAPA